MFVSFDALPDTSRLWVFQSNRLLLDKEQDYIQNQLNDFIKSWETHGVAMQASFELKYGCFVIIAADEDTQSASGCSIGALTTLFKSIESTLELSFFDRFAMAVELDGKIEVMPLNEFKEAIRQGRVEADSLVFNNLIANKLDMQSAWKLPLKNSWQKRYL